MPAPSGGTQRSVIVVDDHPCLRLGVASALALSPHLRVIGEAADGEEALAVIRERLPDLVVLDLLLPHLNGLEVMRALRQELPQVRFVAYSLREEAWFVRDVIAAGAASYVFKSSAQGELVRAVEHLATSDASATPGDASAARAERRRTVGRREAAGIRLSKREADVLRLLARGIALKEAASQLKLGVRTLETYRARAMQKLQLRSRVDLMRFAAHSGWLHESDGASHPSDGASPP